MSQSGVSHCPIYLFVINTGLLMWPASTKGDGAWVQCLVPLDLLLQDMLSCPQVSCELCKVQGPDLLDFRVQRPVPEHLLLACLLDIFKLNDLMRSFSFRHLY